MNEEQTLELIRKAWGRGNRSGYCFFPWMKGDAETRKERTLSFKEGPAFLWPKDKEVILRHMSEHRNDDLFWCPMLFETPYRKAELALEERCLWADLDLVNPKKIEDYPPTVAWETSPNRYQALWLLDGEFIWGASGPGMVNQRLTYHLGADPSGWDTTQLLRLPEWPNHKPERRAENGGKPPIGKLLWKNRQMYMAKDFESLPMVEAEVAVAEILEEEIDRIDRHELWAEVKLKVSSGVREIYEHRDSVTEADHRSDKLWRMERELADVGLTVTQIVALVRGTVWNKFDGRADELKRLTNEAAKAIAQRTPETEAKLEKAKEEEGKEKPTPANLFDLVRSVRPPEWLVQGVFSLGSCGFIAGEPKSYKSWIGLDLALSVASGMKFLNHFDVLQAGPVLYIQEEDAPPLVQSRLGKVWGGKTGDRVEIDPEGQLWWVGPQGAEEPDVDGIIGSGLTISDPGWLEWLDEVLGGKDYKLTILDPLMMVLGDVQETSNAVNERVLKPLKLLARKHDVALLIVHHMRKGRIGEDVRGGQRLLGTQAYHAWSDESLYVSLGDGGLQVEPESKHANVKRFEISAIDDDDWRPQVTPEDAQRRVERVEDPTRAMTGRTNGHRPSAALNNSQRVLTAMATYTEPMPTLAIARASDLLDEAHKGGPAIRVLKKLETKGLVEQLRVPNPKGKWGVKVKLLWTLTEKGRRQTRARG